MNYFGLDWIAILCSFGALELLSSKNRYGFALFLIANICWIVIGYVVGSVPIMLGNIVFFGVNMRGLLRWTQAKTVSSIKYAAQECVAMRTRTQ
jgi:hypothetical protein